VPPVHPAHAAVSNFYQDFRSRLIDLTFGEKKATPKSVEAVIGKQLKNKEPSSQKVNKPGQKKTEPANKPQLKKSQRYLYSDGKGELHFADSLEDVPDKYRGQAQPMGK
jgi:hypothetical protein